MTALTQKITNMLSPFSPTPSSTPPAQSQDPPVTSSSSTPIIFENSEKLKTAPAERHIGITSACRSKTASSCELFGMMKALAAGGNDADMTPSDVGSDEDEESGLVIPSRHSAINPKSTSNALPRAESSTTVRQNSTIGHDGDGKQETMQSWMDETVGRTISQSEVLSSRFAGETGRTVMFKAEPFVALSMSNLSPLVSQDGYPRKAKVPAKKKRPQLPHLHINAVPPQEEPEHPELDTPPSDAETLPSIPPSSGASTPVTDITSPSKLSEEEGKYEDILQDRKISDEEKLQAVVAEFGDIAGLMEGSEPERMLAEAKGSLFK